MGGGVILFILDACVKCVITSSSAIIKLSMFVFLLYEKAAPIQYSINALKTGIDIHTRIGVCC